MGGQGRLVRLLALKPSFKVMVVMGDGAWHKAQHFRHVSVLPCSLTKETMYVCANNAVRRLRIPVADVVSVDRLCMSLGPILVILRLRRRATNTRKLAKDIGRRIKSRGCDAGPGWRRHAPETICRRYVCADD